MEYIEYVDCAETVKGVTEGYQSLDLGDATDDGRFINYGFMDTTGTVYIEFDLTITVTEEGGDYNIHHRFFGLHNGDDTEQFPMIAAWHDCQGAWNGSDCDGYSRVSIALACGEHGAWYQAIFGDINTTYIVQLDASHSQSVEQKYRLYLKSTGQQIGDEQSCFLDNPNVDPFKGIFIGWYNPNHPAETGNRHDFQIDNIAVSSTPILR